MAHLDRHFPTFAWMFRTMEQTSRHVHPGRVLRLWSYERLLLRIALYILLLLSGAHTFLLRIYMNSSGYRFNPNRPYQPNLIPDDSLLGWAVAISAYIFGTQAEFSLIIAVMCLAGLAASSERPQAMLYAPVEVVGGTMPELPPSPPAPTDPPERHPLDPSPDDPPFEPRWSKRGTAP